jgi:hypothetical protein
MFVQKLVQLVRATELSLDSAHFELRRRSSAPIETLLTATKLERLFSRGGGVVRQTSLHRSFDLGTSQHLQYLENTGTQNGSCPLESCTKFFLTTLLFSSVKVEQFP